LVEITIESQTFLKAEERKKIYQAHNGIIYLIPKFKHQQFDENKLSEINLSQDIQTLFKD